MQEKRARRRAAERFGGGTALARNKSVHSSAAKSAKPCEGCSRGVQWKSQQTWYCVVDEKLVDCGKDTAGKCPECAKRAR